MRALRVALRGGYPRGEGASLDRFVVMKRFPRKHAMRLLRGDIEQSSIRRIYEEEEQETEKGAAASGRGNGTKRPHGRGA